MPLVCYVSELEKNVSLDAERLLRLLGVSGKLSGFHFAVYMLEQVQDKPEYVLLITKRLYSQTAQYFHTTTNCVERNLRTLVQACWRQPDHSLLERIAGHPLSQPPTNAQFIDMVTKVYAHILDEDRKVNAQKFESAFYANPDLRSVKAPDEPQPALDVQSIIVQLQQSPELLSALTSLISNQGCK